MITPQPDRRAGLAPFLTADDIAAIAWLAEDMNRRLRAGEFRDLEERHGAIERWTFLDALHATFRRGIDVVASEKKAAEAVAAVESGADYKTPGNPFDPLTL